MKSILILFKENHKKNKTNLVKNVKIYNII